jgi:hypothetical protein
MSKEIVIPVPPTIASEKIIGIIDKAAIDLGLAMTMRATLKSFPGSTHWHLKRGHERGTLEMTWWPQRKKLWLKIHTGRMATWIDKVAPQLKREIESRINDLMRSA